MRECASAVRPPSKVPLRDALEEILSASNLTWKYFNGGTHEEEGRDEFEHVVRMRR